MTKKLYYEIDLLKDLRKLLKKHEVYISYNHQDETIGIYRECDDFPIMTTLMPIDPDILDHEIKEHPDNN